MTTIGRRASEKDEIDMERYKLSMELFGQIWKERKGLKSAKKLWDAAMRTPEGKELKPPLAWAQKFTKDEPRQQVFAKRA